MPAVLSSLIDVPRDDLSAALASEPSRLCLREWLLLVPDPRKRAGRWHPLEFVLVLAVCAFTAAGHDSPTAIAEWAAGCSREALLVLGGRPDPLTGRVRPPSTRTFRRVFARIDADALNQALYGFLEVMPAATPGDLPEVTRHEREQRRAAATAREPAVPGLLPHAAADGKTAGLAGPRHLAVYARNHWAIENREHYVRDVTFREDAQKTRTGSQPNAHAGVRNLVISAFRRKGHANIAAARRYYGRDDQRILALYGYH